MTDEATIRRLKREHNRRKFEGWLLAVGFSAAIWALLALAVIRLVD